MAETAAKTEETMGGRIEAARLAQGMTQQQLANAAESTPAGISDLERDAVGNPGMRRIQRVANALGVTVGFLLGETPAAAERTEV